MKKFKISIVAILAIVMGIAASSFTTSLSKSQASKNHFTNTWFRYMGSSYTLSDLQDNQNYEFVDGTAGCSGTEAICSVKANGVASDGQHPDAFSSDLLSKISDVYNQTNTYPSVISQEEQ